MNFRVYLPKQRFIRSFVSRQHFPAQRKGGGISKGGNPGSPLWLRAEGTHRTDCRLRKNKPDPNRLPRQHSTLFTAASRKYIHARPSERKRGTTRIDSGGTPPPRRDSIGTHDRANGMSDDANMGAASTLPQCEYAPASRCREVYFFWLVHTITEELKERGVQRRIWRS